MATFTAADLTLRLVAAVRILGIDPGTQNVGFACLELRLSTTPTAVGERPLAMRASNTVRAGTGSGDVRVVDLGVLRLGDSQVPLGTRLLELVRQFRATLQSLAPDEVALEEAFYGRSVQAALRIGEARGVILAEAAMAGLAVHQFAPARVKRCVTGRGDASKEMVAAMVGRLVRLPSGIADLPKDATDAVGIALTRVEQRRSPLLGLAGK